MRAFFTITLLIAFVADGVNALSLCFPHRFISQEATVASHDSRDGSSDLVETVKRTPHRAVLKFIDIDSPIAKADFSDGDALLEERYHRSESCRLIDAPPQPMSLHQLCLLLI